MIVVDTNVIAALYLNSEISSLAEEISLMDSDWVAPRLWRSELCNVLATQVRLERLTLADALAAMNGALDLMSNGEYDIGPARVLALTAESACSAYDCEFAALALDLGVSLVTADRQLLERFPGSALAPEDFVAQRGER